MKASHYGHDGPLVFFGDIRCAACGYAMGFLPAIIDMLADPRHKLLFGSNDREAVGKAREPRPDDVLLGIRKTGMDGRFSGHVRKLFSKRALFDELARFLPRQWKASSRDPCPVPVSVTALLDVPPELLAELRRLLACGWPVIRGTLAIIENKAFAVKPDRLNQRWPCPSLDSYADRMARHADMLSGGRAGASLDQFPAFVERFERSASA